MKNKSSILLHICCGPCATVPIKELKETFNVVSYFYNPNIFPEEEVNLRKINAKKVADFYNVDFSQESEDYNFYLSAIKGKEKNINKERCKACYELRLKKTAEKAKEKNIKYFSTSLLISPYQDIEAIKEIGEKLALKNGINFYFKDFRPLFRESRILSKEMDLYRQKYCGCEFSLCENSSTVAP